MALVEVHRVLAPGGTLVDARPDSRVPAYVERRKPRGFQRFGVVKTSRLELANDRASDRAITRVVREGLFKRSVAAVSGIAYHSATSLSSARTCGSTCAFVHRAEWVVDAATRKRHSNDQFVIRRAVRYELLEARTCSVASRRRDVTDPGCSCGKQRGHCGHGTRIINAKAS